MKKSEFSFELPEELIAHYPAVERTGSRLLCLDRQTGDVTHNYFSNFLSLLNPEDLLVFNNTRVIPARLLGHKFSGGQVEILLERIMGEFEAMALIRASRSPKIGAKLNFPFEDGEVSAEILGREGAFFHLKFSSSVLILSEKTGHIPLPPYIKREDELSDRERYQTVYGEKRGAVAAPTAGLHFDEQLLTSIKEKGVEMAMVTLHVGAGTFQPVRTDDIEEHVMHKEYLEVNDQVCRQVKECQNRGGRVIAVGTTSVRCLETASKSGDLMPYKGDTDIFIYPGYKFRVVDALLTNFHLPESTLIMLVSAFAGRDNVLSAYKEAVEEKYRFFSYGDAMFIA